MEDTATIIRNRLLYGTEEACELLSIKRKTLYSLIKRGQIKRHPATRILLVPYSEIERFAKEALIS